MEGPGAPVALAEPKVTLAGAPGPGIQGTAFAHVVLLNPSVCHVPWTFLSCPDRRARCWKHLPAPLAFPSGLPQEPLYLHRLSRAGRQIACQRDGQGADPLAVVGTDQFPPALGYGLHESPVLLQPTIDSAGHLFQTVFGQRLQGDAELMGKGHAVAEDMHAAGGLGHAVG